MIKRLNSKYRPDERKNNWVKLKPEYVDGVRTLALQCLLRFFYPRLLVRLATNSICSFWVVSTEKASVVVVMSVTFFLESRNPEKICAFFFSEPARFRSR